MCDRNVRGEDGAADARQGQGQGRIAPIFAGYVVDAFFGRAQAGVVGAPHSHHETAKAIEPTYRLNDFHRYVHYPGSHFWFVITSRFDQTPVQPEQVE